MPLPGGASDKSGLRYELFWTVRSFIYILEGNAKSIRLEPPGKAGKGIEFYLQTADGVEYHQVKRQKTGKGVWSLKDLGRVLSHFCQRLTDLAATCVFISSHAAHPLDELADRARNAASWEEFQDACISFDSWSVHFRTLHECWQTSSEKDTYHYLKRIRVHTVDEDFLRELVQSRLDVLIDGHPATASDILSQWALDQVHQQLTASDIWEHLKSHRINKRNWAQDPDVQEALSEQNQRYKAGVHPVSIGGEIILRHEVQKIISRFDDEKEGNIVLVSGEAGIGKSSALAQVLTAIQERDWPWLAFRVDRLQPCLSPHEVGEQLRLPGSPVSVLTSLARSQDCLLVIDQLDAISLASGRNVDFFDCIRVMLEQARHHARMRVLLACRQFDIKNDPKLRDLVSAQGMAKKIPIERFDPATVSRLVTQLGLNASEFRLQQLKLLSLPVHLKLLADTLSDHQAGVMHFRTARDLYEGFWRYKQQILRAKDVHAQNVVDRMLQYMNTNEMLFVPEAVLDGIDHVSILLSENILVQDGPRISFFHESFFDFLFARQTAVSDDFDLVKHIMDREQSLFLRSQIRQCLLYQRDIAPLKAQTSIQTLLTQEGIRFHIKETVLSLMGGLDDPKPEEWDILEALLDSDVARHVWGVLWGSRPWFDLLYAMEVLHAWLASDDDALIDKSMDLFRSVYKDRSDQIATLLTPFIGRSEAWNERLRLFITHSVAIGMSRKFLDLTLKAVEDGILDAELAFNNGYSPAWSLIESHLNPEWSYELISGYCSRLLALAQKSGNADPFSRIGDPYYGISNNDVNIVLGAALRAPGKFVEWIMPFVMHTVKLNAAQDGDPPWADSVWKHWCARPEMRYGLGNHILSAIAIALRKLAQDEPTAFQKYAEEFRKTPYLTLQCLLLDAYEANGPYFADDAIEYLLEKPERLAVWHKFNMDWAPQQLIQATATHCASDRLAQLEQALLEFYPEPLKLYPGGCSIYGLTQLQWLVCIPVSHRSVQAAARLRELQRKFGQPSVPEPSVGKAFLIGSPIPETQARKMKDTHWLKAMQRYSSNEADFERRVGGALELSHVLETLTKECPSCFATLAYRIPKDANPAYLKAILSGIRDSNLDAVDIVKICMYCHEWPGRPYGRQITCLLADVATRSRTSFSLPEEALAIVAWYATQAPDDASYRGNDLLMEGINSTKGAAAEDMARLISQNASTLPFFERYLPSMVSEPSMSVRACVAETLLGVLQHNRDLAVQLFVTLCNNADSRLLAASSIEKFLRYALQTHFSSLASILESMIEAKTEPVKDAGARLACFTSLTVEAAYGLVQRCLAGNETLRLGAARIYAAMLGASAYKAQCETVLGQLFSDPDVRVRNVASECFARFEGRQLREYQNLARAYLASPAFGFKINPLVKALHATTASMPDLALETCETFFDVSKTSIQDLQHSAYANLAVDLVVRVYSQTDELSVKQRCIDLIDTISYLGILGLDKIRQEFDR